MRTSHRAAFALGSSLYAVIQWESPAGSQLEQRGDVTQLVHGVLDSLASAARALQIEIDQPTAEEVLSDPHRAYQTLVSQISPHLSRLEHEDPLVPHAFDAGLCGFLIAGTANLSTTNAAVGQTFDRLRRALSAFHEHFSEAELAERVSQTGWLDYLASVFQPRAVCLVLIPLREGFIKLFSTCLKPTIKDLPYGLSCGLAGDVNSPGVLAEGILKDIQSAAVVIADLTDLNPNVLYELGAAHALRVPTVILTQGPEGLPFDLRHFRVIHYTFDGTEALKTKLKDFVASALGSAQ